MQGRFYIFLLLLLFGYTSTSAQMLHGQDTLIGNEWINYNQSYYKFTIEADGVYRIPYAALLSAGISNGTKGSDLKLYSLGEQVAIYVSTDEVFGAGDFIEFYGFRNRGELDRHLYRIPDQDMLNPMYSMYTDRRPYYLSLNPADTTIRVSSLLNDINNPPASEPYYLHKEVIEYHETSYDPYFLIGGGGAISYSSYMHGEGFSKLNQTNSTTQINTSQSASGTPANLHLRVASTNYGEHQFIITWNGDLIDTLRTSNIQIWDTTYTIPMPSVLDINNLAITNSNSLSRHTLVNITLTYPRTNNLNGASESTITLEPKSGDQYYELSGFATNNINPILYTSDGLSRMETEYLSGDVFHFKWPVVQTETTLHIVDPSTAIKPINSLSKISFTDFTNDDTEYIVITHPDILTPGTESEYLQYRISTAGGAYKAKAYSILDIYEQFGYGIEKHPQAVRNFVEFFHRTWPSAKMIFVIGRGIEYNRSRIENGLWEEGFFVPTFGLPGADNLLAATPWNLMPRYPIGRLAITKPIGVDNYLDKVKAHDQSRFTGQTLEEKSWIKNVMHLGGGKTTSEQKEFENILASLGSDLANSDYGAKISFFQKRSTDIIGETESAQILKLLNEGCGIINYLGHSASSTFEYNIQEASEWNNKGRYPIFSAMGCSAGQIHGTRLSLSDNYVQTKDEGAIAFISGSGSQFASALIAWARPWYNYFGNLNYGTTLGESIYYGLKAVSNFVDPTLNGSNSYRYLLEQHTFQGDPALQLHPLPGPDYVVDRRSISILPKVLDTKLDSFDLGFTVSNIGRNLRQNVLYSIKIKLPDGQEIEVGKDTLGTTTFENAVTARIPLLTGGTSGSFRLLISVDPDNEIEELPSPAAEENNQLVDNLGVEGIEFFVVSNLISAVYPPDFSIVTKSIPELIATGSNSFSKSVDIVVQLDTTALFNSPLLVKDKFPNHSSTLKWSPPISWIANQVYYWRVSADSISPAQSYLWSKRSFLYKPGSFPGWNQSHFHQFTENDFYQVLSDSAKYDFTFDSKSTNFNILNRYHDVDQGLIPKVVEDGQIKAEFFTGFRNRNVQAFVVAIDSLTGEFMYNPNPGLYGSANHLSFDARCFPYRMDLPESRQALIDFVENVIPAGYYVFFYTYQHPLYPSYYPELWAEDEATFGKSIYTMIEAQYPSSEIRTLATSGSKPYIIFFQKDRGIIDEIIGYDSTDVISMSVDIKGSFSNGAHISRLIGPASSWYSILSETAVNLPDTTGRNILSAIALSSDFADTLVISTNITSPDTMISAIDAKAYPYIRLTYVIEDSVYYDPAKLQMWRVLYEGYPEFVIQPDAGFEFIADTLNQGERMSLWAHVENVSPYDVDSLAVSLRIIGDNITEEILYEIPALKANSVTPVDFEKITSNLQGDYQVVMEVNPNRMQPELNYNNNIGILPMHVIADDANPILDVTFDGFHIKDGDIVSSNPLIAVQLHDENENLRLQDTSSFIMSLEYPTDFNPRPIYFSMDWVDFLPSPETGLNIALVHLTPDLIEDGIYTLTVNAKDASGNIAGDINYSVSFEVINHAAISYIYNYPNPFSSSTRFIYTLTGPGAPSSYFIEIVSVSGVLVRKISQEQLGGLAGGTHSTVYTWDGTDQNGNPLSAGMYFYRLVAKDENMNDFPTYNPYGASSDANRGWGKLVIVR